ncbi:glycosyltransferase family 4 protein [Nodularia spumigena]|uniref:Glycosyltransferase family 4 protein n=1 Tax=Nodularia spumigena UHCC 0060 TaxID=3110300 RepID=A0ABU5V168_NODSP|nr:glycosyltransferase family 4 protein [Nodularia spumigena]MEA5527912.1 glycosyltransferase family 4 protein [Nodularia spumigena UHCC 0143]MEA5611050.1 glycosyltransferase family 4 protein [Nodularia spumigena UHCC 0060]MEA5616128.1 glycosyltransferase family 4 protein [Nodularia spumigena UHCC 0040]
MRILYIITRADTVGGVQVHVRDLSKALQADGHQVLVITGMAGLYTDDLYTNNIDFCACTTFHKQIKPFQDWQTLRFFLQTIKQFRPDIISTHSSKAGILGRLAGKITKTACLITAHGWAFTEGVPQPTRKIYQIIERLAEPLANQIICVSDHDRHIGLKTGMNPKRLKTIHNGMPDISPSLRANPADSEPVKIVMVARFDKQKDHYTLLQAFQRVSGAQLNLVGDGPGLDNIKNLAVKLGLSQTVNFLGFRQDIPQVLAQAQIFALISHWEGFPLTIIEAMRAGLPVIASDVGGAAEAIDEGVSGFTIPRGDVHTLEDRLKQLIKNAELRYKMGTAARQRYEQEFTFDHMFTQTYQTYENVLLKSKSQG